MKHLNRKKIEDILLDLDEENFGIGLVADGYCPEKVIEEYTFHGEGATYEGSSSNYVPFAEWIDGIKERHGREVGQKIESLWDSYLSVEDGLQADN